MSVTPCEIPASVYALAESISDKLMDSDRRAFEIRFGDVSGLAEGMGQVVDLFLAAFLEEFAVQLTKGYRAFDGDSLDRLSILIKRRLAGDEPAALTWESAFKAIGGFTTPYTVERFAAYSVDSLFGIYSSVPWDSLGQEGEKLGKKDQVLNEKKREVMGRSQRRRLAEIFIASIPDHDQHVQWPDDHRLDDLMRSREAKARPLANPKPDAEPVPEPTPDPEPVTLPDPEPVTPAEESPMASNGLLNGHAPRFTVADPKPDPTSPGVRLDPKSQKYVARIVLNGVRETRSYSTEAEASASYAYSRATGKPLMEPTPDPEAEQEPEPEATPEVEPSPEPGRSKPKSGVTFNPSTGRWHVHMNRAGRMVDLGNYPTEAEASAAHADARRDAFERARATRLATNQAKVTKAGLQKVAVSPAASTSPREVARPAPAPSSSPVVAEAELMVAVAHLIEKSGLNSESVGRALEWAKSRVV